MDRGHAWKAAIVLDPHGIHAYPGPWLAKVSDLWLAWTAFQGQRQRSQEKWTDRARRTEPCIAMDSLPSTLSAISRLDLPSGCSANDSVPVAKSYKAVMQTFGQEKEDIALKDEDFDGVPAIEFLCKRGTFNITMGNSLPTCVSSRSASRGLTRAGRRSRGMRASASLPCPSNSMHHRTVRLLTKLLGARDDDGAKLSPEELTVETLTLLVGGTGTTTNSLMAITHSLVANPRCQEDLPEGVRRGTGQRVFARLCVCGGLRYLDGVITENKRLHSIAGTGLPRVVPEGVVVVLGKFFSAGTVSSLPSYNVYRDTRVWSEDVEVFRPERWLEEIKAFYSFSFGQRACVGRNFVTMEMPIFSASPFRR